MRIETRIVRHTFAHGGIEIDEKLRIKIDGGDWPVLPVGGRGKKLTIKKRNVSAFEDAMARAQEREKSIAARITELEQAEEKLPAPPRMRKNMSAAERLKTTAQMRRMNEQRDVIEAERQAMTDKHTALQQLRADLAIIRDAVEAGDSVDDYDVEFYVYLTWDGDVVVDTESATIGVIDGAEEAGEYADMLGHVYPGPEGLEGWVTRLVKLDPYAGLPPAGDPDEEDGMEDGEMPRTEEVRGISDSPHPASPASGGGEGGGGR